MTRSRWKPASRRCGSALKGDDLEAIKRESASLAEVLQRVGAAAYANQQPVRGTEDYDPSAESGNGAEAPDDGTTADADAEEAVEGEYKEV